MKPEVKPSATISPIQGLRRNTSLHNYLDETKPCVPIAQRVALMALAAKTKGKLLLVSEIRYAIAGMPTEINDDYIYWPECIEIGSTGKLGQRPEEYEHNPGPKLLTFNSFCFAEEIVDPEPGSKKATKQ